VALLVVGICALTMTFVLGSRPSLAPWQVDMLDIGQGDAFLLRFGEDTWLVDAGPSRPMDSGARTIVPHLQREGIDHLRGIIVSHPHQDHYGGVGAVLADVRVDSLYVAAASLQHPVYQHWRQQFTAVPHRGVASGDVVSLAPGSQALVLWPPPTDVLQSGANGVSVSLWIRSQSGPDLLCMGDLEADGEEALLQVWGDSLRAAAGEFLILKTGHHGSNTSSTTAFLDAVDPEVALISAGRRNRYGHPSPTTLAALQQRACLTLRTDAGGDIRVQQRGATLWLRRPASRMQQLVVPEHGPEPGIDAFPAP
jgi:competence protein ComEC